MEIARCSIGLFSSDKCHKHSYTNRSLIITKNELSQDDLELLSRRVGMNEDNIEMVCLHHKKQFLDHYTHLFGGTCCDPLSMHKKPIKYKPMRVITLEMAKNCNHLVLIPGKSICNKCILRLRSNSDESFDLNSNATDVFEDIAEKENEINQICETLSVPPLKRCIKDNEQTRYSKIRRQCKNLLETFQDKLEHSAGIELVDNNDVFKSDQDIFLERLKLRLSKCTSSAERIQILTLMPNSWSIEKTSKFLSGLNVSIYAIRQAKKLLQSEGILPSIDKRPGNNKLPQAVENIAK